MCLSKPEMVLLDLDGTLVDSVPDLAYCIDRMLEHLGLPPRGTEKVRQWMGNGLQRLVKRALVDGFEGETRQCVVRSCVRHIARALWGKHLRAQHAVSRCT